MTTQALTTLSQTLDRELSDGTLTCMQALTYIDAYRWQHPTDGVADVLTETVSAWQQREMDRTARLLAKGV